MIEVRPTVIADSIFYGLEADRYTRFQIVDNRTNKFITNTCFMNKFSYTYSEAG